ncbi:DNA polymerase III subunit chi [Pseudoalteromonas tunicata]|uniref:DNA polymerase III, chi subunit n=1 Tax=Pseudoalteromonas tunicata D2 TaxID=87626 RepID=A4C965_9GAMM|nr:DNA polymerase III subunit chi [Pseudoalteromonas tunicata]ATC93632.1 DNA polymerase III subunit chi [Pseudoalteromonas tunicata]AXT29467.1 DNA polymerase III subunit chi [Pseudoalteromonas tunicata]EAR29130.1 DNA polymerase III, chi subunit [Pseudoalteromonas tunicata D2]MDP4983012.1 DNA polymerase III subunit chi [Pseudoalteromonas tunicata]MDP5211847.1 DNA polymerase III subunit chi [Pseudoalteromonas tunicata]
MNAIFYVQKQENEPDSPIAAHFDLAAKIAADCYRQGQRVFIYTENKTDAHLIDEYLWQFEANSFVPHNLQGEGPHNGAPVEIGDSTPVGNRKILINLALHVPDFIRRFNQVYDFVPFQEEQKQAARERYKQLRQLGANISTIDIEH